LTSLHSPEHCVQTVLDAARISGKQRVLLSGSLWPQWLEAITSQLREHNLSVNEPDPDPLGFENLVSSVSPDMVCVIVQNPSFFGNIRDLTALKSECREWEVPLYELGHPCSTACDTQAADKGADAPARRGLKISLNPDHHRDLSHKLHQLPGIRVITDDFHSRFSLYLGEDFDAADLLEPLRIQGVEDCEAAGLAYPSYPELRPVLIVETPVDGDKLITALREALALLTKHR